MQDGPRSRSTPPDPRVNTLVSALGKPWVNGKVLKIVDGKPQWADEAGGGGPSALAWMPLEFSFVATDAGSFGHPAVAIDADLGLLYIAGAVALLPSFPNAGTFGWITKATYPSVPFDTLWPPEFGTRRYSSMAWDGTTFVPTYVAVSNVPSGPGTRIEFEATVGGVAGSTLLSTAGYASGLTLLPDQVLRFAPPSASP